MFSLAESTSERKVFAPINLQKNEKSTLDGGKMIPLSRDVGEIVTPEMVYEASKRLVAAGLSVIPIDAYFGSKSPDNARLPRPHNQFSGNPEPSWSAFEMCQPTEDDLRRWYNRNGDYGLAVVAGTVSGGAYGFGLEVIDFDSIELADPWKVAVEKQVPGLVDRLVNIRTPRPGMHVYYRCKEYGGNQKLARGISKDSLGNVELNAQGNPVPKTLVEVKAEGGYCLIPPSPSRCHPLNRPYEYCPGSPDLTAVPTISPAERTILLNAARALNQWTDPVRPARMAKTRGKRSGVGRPGDDFNERAQWSEILQPHGWKQIGAYGEEERFCRPGKGEGVSATTNHGGSRLLHVFTSNAAPFEQDRSYLKFSAYTLLNHNGNFDQAAEDLRERGYGAKMLKKGKR